MTRAEYITCIAKTDAPNVSWCGRNISMVASFENIGHAKRAVAQGSRLTICPECWTMKVTEGEMTKIHEALLRFKDIVDNQECLCEEVYRCTVHMDRLIANRALEEYENGWGHEI